GALTLGGNPAAVVYPFVLGGISVLGAIIGILYVAVVKGAPGNVLMGAVMASGVVSAVLYWPATHMLFREPVKVGDLAHTATDLYFASLIGLVMTGVVVMITNYYTSTAFPPVRNLAKASETGHATNIHPQHDIA